VNKAATAGIFPVIAKYKGGEYGFSRSGGAGDKQGGEGKFYYFICKIIFVFESSVYLW